MIESSEELQPSEVYVNHGNPVPELTTEEKIDDIHKQLQQILTFVENINNQVQPFMDKLKNSPLGAMFGG